MQGNGTQESPFIPENWEEFVEAIVASGAYVTMPDDGGFFDMNDIAPEGGLTVTFKCSSIEGNGWEIRNAYNVRFVNNSGSSGNVINQLHFLNGFTDSLPLLQMPYGTANKCKISGVISGETSVSALSMGTYTRCSMNFKFIDEAFQISGRKNGITCNFVNAVIDQSDSKMPENANFYNFTGNNSFFEHKASSDGGQLKLSDSKSTIVHSDAGSYIITATGSSVDVTEEQLKSAAYLRSIGFPIAGD